jgi:hypothetical protein
LENNHENLEERDYTSFDYLLQSTAWLPSYFKHLSHNTADNTCILKFGRYMIHNIAFRANWDEIKKEDRI